jgi:hypothetical protein
VLSPTVLDMNAIKVLVLLIAVSSALNIAFVAGILSRADGRSIMTSTFIGAGAAASALTIFFAALPSYQ